MLSVAECVCVQLVVDRCGNVQHVCADLIASTEKTGPICERALSAFKDMDDGV